MKRVPFVEIDGEPYARWWCDRFDPPCDPLAGMRFYQRGRTTIWVGTADVAGLTSTRMDAVGIHLLRISRRYWKPTSSAIVAFAGSARASYIELNRDEVVGFLAGADLPLDEDDPRRDGLARGFLAARYLGVGVGCAEWHGRDALMSLIPKNKRIESLDL